MPTDLFDGRDDPEGNRDQRIRIDSGPKLPPLNWYLLGPTLVALVAFLTYPLRLALDYFIPFAPLAMHTGLGLWMLTVGILVAGLVTVKAVKVIR